MNIFYLDESKESNVKLGFQFVLYLVEKPDIFVGIGLSLWEYKTIIL